MLSHLELGKVAGEILVMFLIHAPFLKTLILKVSKVIDWFKLAMPLSNCWILQNAIGSHQNCYLVVDCCLVCDLLCLTHDRQELLQFGEELCDSEFVPHCFKSNLQEVYFGRLNGDEHELRFAKYVLENAQVLETANFSATWKLQNSNFQYVRESILSFKRSDRFFFMQFSSY